MGACDLCGLPTPDPAVAADDVDGAFCCRGCLEVSRRVGTDVDLDPHPGRDAATTDPPEDGEVTYLRVDGMHCSTCETFIESSAVDEPGVLAADASYAADLVRVTYAPDEVDAATLPDRLSGLGYTVYGVDEDRPGDGPPWRLLLGLFVAMPVMVWYLVFLYPRYLGVAPATPAWDVGPTGVASLVNLWALTTVILLVTGYPILRGAYVSLRARQPNMDLLVSLAAVNAYLYSGLTVLTGGTEVYFDITVVVILAVTIGNHYEARIKRRAADRLAAVTADRVSTARVRTGAGHEEVPVDALGGGETILVRAGERVPVDGTIHEGDGAVDESLVTGESLPDRRTPGDAVVGGSVLVEGAITVEVDDGRSRADRLADRLWDAQTTRPGAQRLADRLAAVFVPAVVLVAIGAGAAQTVMGHAPSTAVLTGLSVLVVSCPCALGLATPLAVARGVRDALRDGIVIQDAATFETADDVGLVVFDKTGTLTTGRMRVLAPASDRAMALAAAVESYSEHPIAAAIAGHTSPAGTVTEFTRHPVGGVTGVVDGERVVVGSPALLADQGLEVPEPLEDRVAAARADGNVPVLVGWGDEARSIAVVGDEPRAGWRNVVTDLARTDREVVVLTGDADAAATRFREHPDIDEVYAGVQPEAKAEIVARLRREARTAMVGDGTNDAPALATADLGIAMDESAAISTDAADVALVDGELAGVPRVFGLIHRTNRRIKGNLAWAFAYNAIAIPVAAAGFLSPVVAAVAMAASSLLVVANSSRPVTPDVPSGAIRDPPSGVDPIPE